VFYIIGLFILLMWLLGLLGPYTITGFITILLTTAILNFLLRKSNRFNLFKIKLYKKLGSNQ
jgi:hypothetical protein